jgi:hypothetical protein
MRLIFWKISGIALLMSSVAYGQSLGDIARENREKQNAEDASSTSKPKVITNKDLPRDPDANLAPSVTPPVANASVSAAGSATASASTSSKTAESRIAERHYADQRLAEQRAAERWRREILTQKNKIATLQARLDQIHQSIRFAGGDVQSEGPLNRSEARQLVQVQQQFNEQKRKLDQLQEAARRAGMHSAVYDP